MRDFRDAKAMGGSLRKALEARGHLITHSDSLELISNAFGFDNWNILAARIEATKPPDAPVLRSSENPGEPHDTLYCSFCGKSQHQVERLIAGPKVFICNECVALCDDIIEEEDQIGQLLAAEKNGGSLAELLQEKSDDQLSILQRSTTRTSQQSGKSARIIEAILSGAGAEPSAPAEDRALEAVLRLRSLESLKNQRSGTKTRKANADRVLAEVVKALAARGT